MSRQIESQGDSGRIDRIPVRNLWLLMLYASQLYRELGKSDVAVEEAPDEIPDLVANILSREVERRLKRNLTHGFQRQHRVLSRVRGRIDALFTERRQLLDRGLIACRFDELTPDTPRNRYVKAALSTLALVVNQQALAHRCRLLARELGFLGVADSKPNYRDVSLDTVGRHQGHDLPMIHAARLAFDLALPTETAGGFRLPVPGRDAHWVRLLYEKAVAGFYDVALAGSGWHVIAGRQLHWPTQESTPGIDGILPSMKTDIVLNHPARGSRLVIDTKFTEILKPGWYRSESLHSGYLYQIYAYLRSQEESDSMAGTASGLLLHPAVDTHVDEGTVIQGHRIRFATVDLAAPAREIRERLLEMVPG
ncbi:MAG: 5-methylcytosine-specific restriction endonuclease system specificity protein McrC [Dehalococcoidia bacterium]